MKKKKAQERLLPWAHGPWGKRTRSNRSVVGDWRVVKVSWVRGSRAACQNRQDKTSSQLCIMMLYNVNKEVLRLVAAVYFDLWIKIVHFYFYPYYKFTSSTMRPNNKTICLRVISLNFCFPKNFISLMLPDNLKSS